MVNARPPLLVPFSDSDPLMAAPLQSQMRGAWQGAN
jgi:hypothetical protein